MAPLLIGRTASYTRAIRHDWVLRMALALSPCITLVACALAIGGTTQRIEFYSNPVGANCTLSRDGTTLGNFVTPAQVDVPRSRATAELLCTKAGYKDAKALLGRRPNGEVMGNLVAGGLIGFAADAASGANNKYDESVTIDLQPAE